MFSLISTNLQGIQSALFHPIETATMSEVIVCISDSDDEEIPNPVSTRQATATTTATTAAVTTTPTTATTTKTTTHKYYNYNEYDWTLPPRVPEEKENVVYVPDDTEETELLIGPISKFTRGILFGDQLSGPSPEVPYKLLLDLENYLNKKLKTISTVGLDLWEYTINQLVAMRMVYGETEVC